MSFFFFFFVCKKNVLLLFAIIFFSPYGYIKIYLRDLILSHDSKLIGIGESHFTLRRILEK